MVWNSWNRSDRTERTTGFQLPSRTASEFFVGLTRTTASDSSGDEGDFVNSWKRSDCSDRQLNEETVPPYQKCEFFEFRRTSSRGSPLVRLCLLRSSNANETGRSRLNQHSEAPVWLRISAEARRFALHWLGTSYELPVSPSLG